MVEISFEMVAADELMKDAVEFDDCGLIEGKKILIVEDNKLNRMLFAPDGQEYERDSGRGRKWA